MLLILPLKNGIANHNVESKVFGGTNIGRSNKKKQRKVKTIHKVIEKEILIAAVVDQIQLDIEKEETDPLRMLVEYLPSGVLLSFLPDDYLDKDDNSYE